MAALSVVSMRSTVQIRTDDHSLKSIALFCCVGLVVSLCLMASGVDLSCHAGSNHTALCTVCFRRGGPSAARPSPMLDLFSAASRRRSDRRSQPKSCVILAG